MQLELRASASSRWMTCTASTAIDVTHLAPSKRDASADLGTCLHEVAKESLLKGTNPKQYIGSIFNDMEVPRQGVDEIVVPYVNYVRKQAKGFKLIVETTVEFNEAIGGTPDVVIIGPDFIHVIDLKTGRKKVEVVDNSQLLIYLLSVYEKYNWIYEFEKFAITIFQPMANNIATHWLSTNDLLKFKSRLLEVYDRILNLDVSFAPSQSNCFYCPAAGICPALTQKATELAQLDFAPDRLTGEELAKKIELIETIQPFIDAVKREALHRLLNNIRVPGFKLHPGNNRYEWKDQRKAIIALREAGLDGYFTDPVLRSPAPPGLPRPRPRPHCLPSW